MKNTEIISIMYNFGEACLIKWPSDSTADTWTSETHTALLLKNWLQVKADG